MQAAKTVFRILLFEMFRIPIRWLQLCLGVLIVCFSVYLFILNTSLPYQGAKLIDYVERSVLDKLYVKETEDILDDHPDLSAADLSFGMGLDEERRIAVNGV